MAREFPQRCGKLDCGQLAYIRSLYFILYFSLRVTVTACTGAPVHVRVLV